MNPEALQAIADRIAEMELIRVDAGEALKEHARFHRTNGC